MVTMLKNWNPAWWIRNKTRKNSLASRTFGDLWTRLDAVAEIQFEEGLDENIQKENTCFGVPIEAFESLKKENQLVVKQKNYEGRAWNMEQ